ncbi:MAG: type 1 glutamine amidotransferase domain-containing protein, partial [Mycobacterium sp.]
MANVLIPIPDRDFDPTEVAVSWRVLSGNGHRVIFASESGTPGVADDIMVTGRGLDIWSAIPVLGAMAIVGRILRANTDARSAYQDMLDSAEYQHPRSWAQTTLDGVDALVLPGGHRARGMRRYIDSDTLHRLVVDAFAGGTT